MPPTIFPCGGTNQPACPPTHASPTNDPILVPEAEIAQAWFRISKDQRKELTKQFSPHGE